MQANNNPIDNLLKAVTFILVFILLTRTPVDADLWWHLRAGQEMWLGKSILLTDQFSYTRFGAPWLNAFWLSDLVFFFLYQAGGAFAIALLVSFTGALTFHIVRRHLPGNSISKSAIVLLAALTAAPIWGPRPQIFSFILVAWLDSWLNEDEHGNLYPHWALVPLFVLWANLHGGWIWGFLLLLAHIVGRLVDRFWHGQNAESSNSTPRQIVSLAAWSALATLAVGLNPNGFAIWLLPFQQVNVSMQIQEWLSPDFHRPDFHPFLWMLFLLLAGAALAKKTASWATILKVTGFAYLTFVAQRNIALFAIVSAPALADWWNAISAKFRKADHSLMPQRLSARLSAVINVLIVASLAVAAIGYTVVTTQPDEINKNYPVEAVNWLRKFHPEGRLFNSYNWGGYIVWNLPEYPVFIDGRADLYGEEILDEWRQVVNASTDAQVILDRWNVKLVLLEPSWPVNEYLQSNGWIILYRDEKAILLGR